MQKILLLFVLGILLMSFDKVENTPPVVLDRNDNGITLNIPLTGSLQNPAFSPDNESIVFTRFVNGYNLEPAEIYKYHMATEQLTLLVSDGSGNINLPGSSWNNGNITFASTRDPHDEIYMIAENGQPGDEVQITSRPNDVAYEPTFSPNGNWVVFESHVLDVETGGIITKYKVDGTSAYVGLTDVGDDCRQPNWSPSGNKILYQRLDNGQWNIWIMNPNGTNKTQLTSNLGNCTDASFAADGQSVIFSSDFQVAIANIYQISIDGTNPIQLTDFDGYDGATSISSDGTKLVFESSDGEPDGATTKIVLLDLSEDPREFNHGTCIVEYENNANLIKYYLTWSSAYNDGWEHDIYNSTISFNASGGLVVETANQVYVGSGSDEAQEPVNATINTGNNYILSVWEDGIDADGPNVRGQLHNPDGTIIKSNWIIAGGAGSQHSANTAHLSNKYLVFYADEAPPASGGAVLKAKVIDDVTGNETQAMSFTPNDEDHWWPVSVSNTSNTRTLIIWGNDGYATRGTVLKDNGGTIEQTVAPQDYLTNIQQYYYQVEWLENISKFLLIARNGAYENMTDDSQVCLIDINGNITSSAVVSGGIIREAKMAVKWNPSNQTYFIFYPSGTNNLTQFSIDNVGTISNSSSQITGHPDLAGVQWTSTGMWASFVTDGNGNDQFANKYIALFVMNDILSNNIINVPVHLDVTLFAGPLAVEYLAPLRAQVIDSQVELSWSTASEVNSKSFEVERTADLREWQKIGTLNAKNNSNTATTYTAIDSSPLIATSYYRLKQMDFDGTFSYSNTVSVHFENIGFSIYPNPTNEWIRLILSKRTKATVVIADLTGKVFVRKTIDDNQVYIDLSRFSAGEYLVSVYTNGAILSEKIILQK